jgi:chromosome segregation ATPase
MELTAPVIIFAIVILALMVWGAFAVGRSGEEKRKIQALKEAEDSSVAAMDVLRKQSQDKLDVMAKASANDIEQQKQAHSRQIDQVNQAHQALVDSLKATHLSEIDRLSSEHSGQLDRMNASNNANIAELEQRRQDEIQQLKRESAEATSVLKSEHRQAVEDLRAERERRVEEAEQRSRQEIERLQAGVGELEAERERNLARVAELEQALAAMREEIRETKLNNMFSMSKSGEKLIRVVRSVQELATELDETSRTVTDGEYSFFDRIKDQRDRDAVLRLAGDDASYTPQAATVEASTESPDSEPGGEGTKADRDAAS